MANVNIKFNGKEFLLSCDDGQEDHLEEKYKSLVEDYNDLSKKLDEFHNQEKIEKKKQLEFSEKIDELNQETDNLLDEIDKWQM